MIQFLGTELPEISCFLRTSFKYHNLFSHDCYEGYFFYDFVESVTIQIIERKVEVRLDETSCQLGR